MSERDFFVSPYGAQAQDYNVGQRVQLHPATDAWMSGDKYGEVERVGRRFLSVRMDRSGDLLMVDPRNVYEVIR